VRWCYRRFRTIASPSEFLRESFEIDVSRNKSLVSKRPLSELILPWRGCCRERLHRLTHAISDTALASAMDRLFSCQSPGGSIQSRLLIARAVP